MYPFMTSRYPNFPNLWKPDAMGSLFIVKVPPDLEMLDESTYLALMQTRLDRMIQDSVSETSQPETQQLLATLLKRIGPGPAHANRGSGRRPGLRPGVLATAVGRDPDSEQLAVSGNDCATTGRAFRQRP